MMLPSPNSFDLLLDVCPSVQEGLETLLEIVNVVGGGHDRLVAVGIQADIHVSNLEAHILRLIRIGFDAEERLECRLGSGHVRDGIDDRFSTVTHVKPLTDGYAFIPLDLRANRWAA